MKKTILTSIKGWLIFSIICGVLYTSVVTVIGQVAFPDKANGSLITKQLNNQTVAIGSHLIGQTFTEDRYLHGRASEVSQLSPVSKEQAEKVAQRVEKNNQTDIPVDLVTASASGVDPHISVDAAYFQAERIAKARNLTSEQVELIIDKHVKSSIIGLKESKYVNVLEINLALDELK